MNTSLKIGDIVMLKSGGPRMTVNKIDQYDSKLDVECKWYIEYLSGYKVCWFNSATLKVIETNS